jgi:hypothetical protein
MQLDRNDNILSTANFKTITKNKTLGDFLAAEEAPEENSSS